MITKKNKTPKKKQKKNKSSFNLLGSLGDLASGVQSTIIKLGTISETLVYEELLANNYLNINSFAQKIEKNKSGKKGKKILLVNDFLKNFDPTLKYVGQKIAFEYEGKNIQADLLIYKDNVFYIFEIKSSNQFDTKKSVAEQESLFSNTISLQKLLLKSNNSYLSNCLVKGYICCLDAEDNKEIFQGFKNNILDNELMWENEDFKLIMNGQLAKIKKHDLIGHSNISYIMKHFVESDISHSAFSEQLIRKFGTYVCTGKSFCSTFGIDFDRLSKLRFDQTKITLSSTIEEKIIEFDCDKETADLMRTTLLNFYYNDLRINYLKSYTAPEQLELDFN